MSALLTDKTMAKPSWAGLHTGRANLLNIMQKTLSALLARHLRRVEAELRSFDRRMWPRWQQNRIRAAGRRTGAHKRRAAPPGSRKRLVSGIDETTYSTTGAPKRSPIKQPS
jgi:hypothetical protein